MNQGEPRCITFSGLGVERAVASEVLRAIGGNAVEAAVEAAERIRQQLGEQRRAVELELEQARYEARLAARRYEAVDPERRLVAAELEARWNTALQKAQALGERLRDFDDAGKTPAIPDKEILLSLAQDLPAMWNAPGTDAGLKQRIVRILVEELVVDVDEDKQDIVVLIHWAGGRHSELRVSKRGTGRHGQSTGMEASEVIRQMAGKFGDGEIAATLNRSRQQLECGAGLRGAASTGVAERRQERGESDGDLATSRRADRGQRVEHQAADRSESAFGYASGAQRTLGDLAGCTECAGGATVNREHSQA